MTDVAQRRPRVLLGVSGSVAAVKVPELAQKLNEFAEVSFVQQQQTSRYLTDIVAAKSAHEVAHDPVHLLAMHRCAS